MNKTILVGNLAKDPERKKTPVGTPVATFTVAVRRSFKNENGNYNADFINCVAWRSTADFIANYFRKGSKIGIVGSLQSRSYDDKNGNKRYVTEVLVDEVEFCGSANGNKKVEEDNGSNDFVEISLADLDNAELPF